MADKKIYTSSDGRKFVVRKKGNCLVAVSEENKSPYGRVNIKTEDYIGGTHCFEGLREALKKYREKYKNPKAPKFYQAVLVPIKDIVQHCYPHAPQITIADRMGDDHATCPECGENEWILLPKEGAAVTQGGKPYMECKNCGYHTHF